MILPKHQIITGPMPDPMAQKYVQLLFVLNWLEKFGEKIEVFEASPELALGQRFVGKNAVIHFDESQRKWVGIEITTGDDL